MLSLPIPTFNDEPSDFRSLFRFASRILGCPGPIRLDFSRCRFLHQNAVTLLGGLARLRQSQERPLTFAWETMSDPLRANLSQNGFASQFGYEAVPWRGNSIPYREDRRQDPAGIVTYLESRWLGRGWLNVSPKLRGEIVGTVWEIYANAFEHSGSTVGVFSCGQHFPAKKQLTLSVLDLGIGIPENVRLFFSQPQIASERALKWAFRQGASTKREVSRGLGLALLKEFLSLNGGELQVFSQNAHALINSQTETYSVLPVSLPGTMVNLTLSCDTSYYLLKSEVRAI